MTPRAGTQIPTPLTQGTSTAALEVIGATATGARVTVLTRAPQSRDRRISRYSYTSHRSKIGGTGLRTTLGQLRARSLVRTRRLTAVHEELTTVHG